MGNRNTRYLTPVRDAIMKVGSSTTEEQSINAIWAKAKAELKQEGVTRAQVQAQLKKLEIKKQARSRLVYKSENECQRGRKTHLLYRFPEKGSDARNLQVAALRQEIEATQTRKRKTKGESHAMVADFLRSPLPQK